MPQSSSITGYFSFLFLVVVVLLLVEWVVLSIGLVGLVVWSPSLRVTWPVLCSNFHFF